MRRELITDREAICLVIIFYMGSSFILGVGGISKNDGWISVLIGIILATPVVLVYARILSLFPEKGLFEIIDWAFGKVLGKIFALFFIWYSFHLGALVIRNFGEFINTVAMPETPMLFTMLCLGLICVVAVRSGIEVMSRICVSVFPLLLVVIFSVQLIGLPQMHFNFLKPILGNGLIPVIKGGFSAFSFPFAESVLLMGVFFSLKTKKSPYKVYLIGTAIAGLLILIITIRNIVVLGITYTNYYFPAHVAVSMLSIGDFLQRIELTVAINFVFGVFIKTSVCLYVTSHGVAKLFNLKDYRSIVIQLALLMVFFAQSIYNSILEMTDWAFNVYDYYAFPFQVILPIILFITVEIKIRMKKKLVKDPF